ncbi:MAG: hypothetical protein ACTSP4_00560 [Candidatus Hodarchaeales archaeon]
MSDQSLEFYVIFIEGNAWWRYLLKDGFGHIYVMYKDNYNWMMFDPAQDRLNIEILPYSAQKTSIGEIIERTQLLQDSTILKLRTFTEKRLLTCPPIKWVTCTDIAKYIMGIECGGKTPYAFYKKLINKPHKIKGLVSVTTILDDQGE